MNHLLQQINEFYKLATELESSVKEKMADELDHKFRTVIDRLSPYVLDNQGPTNNSGELMLLLSNYPEQHESHNKSGLDTDLVLTDQSFNKLIEYAANLLKNTFKIRNIYYTNPDKIKDEQTSHENYPFKTRELIAEIEF